MASLENKIAIVTGGASGIGLATAKAFTEKGAKVVISDYNEESDKAVEKELTEKGADVCFIRADASDEQSVAGLATRPSYSSVKMNL